MSQSELFRDGTEKLTEEEFTHKLSEWMHKQGIVRELRSFLRHRLVTALRSTALVKPSTWNTPLPPALQALDLLVAEHLAARNCHYSLSVMVSEVPMLATVLPHPVTDPTQVTSNLDELRFQLKDLEGLLGCLGIPSDSEIFTFIRNEYEERKGPSLLGCVLRVMARTAKTSSVRVQDEEEEEEEEEQQQLTLAEKLQRVDEDYEWKKKGLGLGEVEGQMLKMRIEMEKKKKEEVEREIARFRESEEMKMRSQVEAECRSLLRKRQEELDIKMSEKLRLTEERLTRREEDIDRQQKELFGHRQEILSGLDQVRRKQDEIRDRESRVELHEALLAERERSWEACHELREIEKRSLKTTERGTATSPREEVPEKEDTTQQIQSPIIQHTAPEGLQDVMSLLHKALQQQEDLKNELVQRPLQQSAQLPRPEKSTASTQAIETRSAGVQTAKEDHHVINAERPTRDIPQLFHHQNVSQLDIPQRSQMDISQHSQPDISLPFQQLSDQLQFIRKGLRETRENVEATESRLSQPISSVPKESVSPTEDFVRRSRDRLQSFEWETNQLDHAYEHYRRESARKSAFAAFASPKRQPSTPRRTEEVPHWVLEMIAKLQEAPQEKMSQEVLTKPTDFPQQFPVKIIGETSRDIVKEKKTSPLEETTAEVVKADKPIQVQSKTPEIEPGITPMQSHPPESEPKKVITNQPELPESEPKKPVPTETKNVSSVAEIPQEDNETMQELTAKKSPEASVVVDLDAAWRSSKLNSPVASIRSEVSEEVSLMAQKSGAVVRSKVMQQLPKESRSPSPKESSSSHQISFGGSGAMSGDDFW